MICSKKGVESFPFFLFLSILIAAFVLAMGFYQVNSFLGLSSQRDAAGAYNSIIDTMDSLKGSSDEGSFKRVTVTIPAGYSIEINSSSDEMKIWGDNLNITNKLEYNIVRLSDKDGVFIEKLLLSGGSYELVIYYGNDSQQDEKYQISFE